MSELTRLDPDEGTMPHPDYPWAYPGRFCILRIQGQPAQYSTLQTYPFNRMGKQAVVAITDITGLYRMDLID